MTPQTIIKEARKIVIKIGSNTLANKDGTVNVEFMEKFSAECSALMAQGKQLIIVSSGAQVAGLSTIEGWAHKGDIHYRQALASIGQVELMHKWRCAFKTKEIHVAQLLLTKDDFEDKHRTLNIRNTLFTLVDENVIPIINENDSIATDEFFIGDNDNLSALTANLWSADLLILFSDIDGVYTDNPKTNPEAKLIEVVESIDDLKKQIKIGSTNSFGTGGIATKIEAAEKTTKCGIPLLLANGGKENPLTHLADGSQKGTLFIADDKALFHAIMG
ncbi:MAG: glutamate 5-kinase [Treponema sp.]|nr:glutamate 5-kinase [Spirochaetia bacterium]MEE0893858.1 glutamate 5-kinase [Treponema sp.]